MEPAMRKEGIELRHVIGPGTRHAIHPEGKEEVERRMVELAKLEKKQVRTFTTPTLRFNRNQSLAIDELDEHWQFGRLQMTVAEIPDKGQTIIFKAEGISAF